MGRSTESTLLLASLGLRPTSRFAGLKVGAKTKPHGQGELSCFMFRLMTINNFLVRSIFLFFLCRCETWPTLMSAGHQKRHNRGACEQAIQKAFHVYSRELIGSLQPRIESRRSSEPLLLPPLNFHLPSEDCSKPFAN